MKSLFSLSLGGALLALSLSVSAGGLKVDLASASTSLSASQDVSVRVTLSNPTAAPIKVLKWYTPIERVEDHLFRITRDGQEVPYLGAHYKRPAPTDKDYVTLEPGQSLTRSVELSGLYDLSVTGSYTIEYDVSSLNLYGRSRLPTALASTEAVSQDSMQSLSSNRVSLWIQGQPMAGTRSWQEKLGLDSYAGLAATPMAGSVGFSNCSNTRQTQIQSAVASAKTYAGDALSYLTAGNKGSRYTTWFGTYNTSRYSTAKSHYTAIKDAVNNKPLVFDCGCSDSYYAYVYPTQPYKIYVCNAFWSAPTTGTDSKAGTIIHELSHFNVVAGTDDWVYGQSGAKSLAKSNPKKALDNADSHEYFAENNPKLN